jgi:molybdate transport system permease protein
VSRAGWFGALGVGALALALVFLTFPVVAIFVDVGPGKLAGSLDDPGAVDALRLSFETTTIALAAILVVGTPAAWLLATRSFAGKALVVTLVELPLVMPPAVAGIGLLAALGPRGLLGGAVQDAGVELVFATAGVVVALTFVASTFARVAIPAASRGLITGAALAWGRALGEFGATLLFAGSLRGVTQTAPLAIFERFTTDFPGALALSAVLVAVAAAILLGVKLLSDLPFGGAEA